MQNSYFVETHHEDASARFLIIEASSAEEAETRAFGLTGVEPYYVCQVIDDENGLIFLEGEYAA